MALRRFLCETSKAANHHQHTVVGRGVAYFLYAPGAPEVCARRTTSAAICVKLPPVGIISPNTTPPEQPNTPVAFDISITNPNDPAVRPADAYERCARSERCDDQ